MCLCNLKNSNYTQEYLAKSEHLQTYPIDIEIFANIVESSGTRKNSRKILCNAIVENAGENIRKCEYTRLKVMLIFIRVLDPILQMIFMIVHKEFALDTIHLTQKSDVRQATYPKIWQQVPGQEGILEQSPEIQWLVEPISRRIYDVFLFFFSRIKTIISWDQRKWNNKAMCNISDAEVLNAHSAKHLISKEFSYRALWLLWKSVEHFSTFF